MASNKPDECKKLHCDLIADLTQYIYVGWDGYNQLLRRMEGRGLTPAEKYNSENNVNKFFEYLEERGLIEVGEYGSLLDALGNRNEPARKLIMEYKAKIDGVKGDKEKVSNKRPTSENPEPSCSKVKKIKKVTKRKVNLKKEEKRNQRTLTISEKQTRVRIKDHISSLTYVRTKAVKEGMAKLEKNGVLIYVGLPGDGKTENAIDIMSIYYQEDPKKCFEILTDIDDWSNVDPDIDSIILLDDVLGSTNTNISVIEKGKHVWDKMYSSITQGKVKIIFTVRKSILKKNQTELEQYPLFHKKHVLDLTLSDSEKKEIFTAHCHVKGIEIVTDVLKENYEKADDLDMNTPVRISTCAVFEIVKSNPVIGYPLACFYFFYDAKYIKQGYNFFMKPTQNLKDEISSLKDLESKCLEKLKYCIMSYMVLQGGKINLDKLDQSLFGKICDSFGIKSSKCLPIYLRQVSEKINHKYIIGEYPDFKFIHPTMFEAVAVCLGEDNAQLLLRFCSERFISEFVRPQNYKNEGEVVIKLCKSNYIHLIQRIIDHLQNKIHESFPSCKSWWVDLHVTDDVHFVDLLIDIISEKENKHILKFLMLHYNNLLNCLFVSDKVILLDRLYKRLFCEKNLRFSKVFQNNCVFVKKKILRWVLDEKIYIDRTYIWFKCIFFGTLGELINHPNIIWSNIELNALRNVLIRACIHGERDIIDKIFSERPDVINQENINMLVKFACVGCGEDVIESLLLKLQHLNPETFCLAENVESTKIVNIAAFFGRFDVLMKLNEFGLVIDLTSYVDKSILTYAMEGYGFIIYFDIDPVLSFFSKSYEECGVDFWRAELLSSIENEMLNNLHCHTKLLEYLIKHKDCDLQDLDRRLDNDDTLAHFCVIQDNPTIIKLLKKVRPSLFSQIDEKGHTPLHIAVLLGRYEIFKSLYSVEDYIPEYVITEAKEITVSKIFDFDDIPSIHYYYTSFDTPVGDGQSYTKILETISKARIMLIIRNT